jgi:iron complex outermembrane receptor protein
MLITVTRKSTLFIFSLSLTLFLHAQTGTVQGTVLGLANAPLAGASVIVQGTSKGTTVAGDGTYSLSLNAGTYTITASFVGFVAARQTVTVQAGQTVTADFNLVESGLGNEVVVLGSRSVPRTRTETAVPVDVIPIGQVINDIGQVDLNQILTFIAPSFQSSRQTVSDGTDHLDPAQLRGLGTDQVLVLINGKRRHQSALVNVNGTVNRGQVSTDLSAIPATAIERIEILRDGASAQYGSDAIAGVINVVLKKQTGLLESNLSYGFHHTSYPKNYALYKILGKTDNPDVSVTDGNTFQASLGYGFNVGKGYLTLNGEYVNREPTNRTGTYTGAVYPNVNSVNRDDSILAARGLTQNDFDLRAGNSGMKSGAFFYNFGYPVENGELYLFGGYSQKNGNAAGLYRYPSAIVSASNAGKYASNVFQIYPNGFLPEIETDIEDFSTSVGFRTKIGEWNFDISNTYGVNTFGFGVRNSINYSQFALAGNNQTSFDAGGLKFYQNTANADFSKRYDIMSGLNVATGLEYRVDAFGIMTGEEASYANYDIPAGVAPGAQVFPGFVNTIGNDKTRKAKAVYLDLEQEFTDKFLLTGAVRYEHYSDFGSTVNYKFSGRYKFGDAFNLRASVSSGFRAPSLQQRYYEKTNTLFITQGGNLVPVQAGTFTNDSEIAALLGIPKLKEETSQNYSIGATARPFAGLEITVDAYQIAIKDRIILTNNFNGATSAQIKSILDAAGASTANFFTNAIDTRATGLEAVVSYSKRFNKHSLRTTLAMTFIDNQVEKDAAGKPIIHASDILVNGGQLANYFNREDQSRVEIANPKNKISLMLNYKVSKFGAMVRLVKFGQVQYLDGSNATDPFAQVFSTNAFTGQIEVTDQAFAPKVVTDLSLSYELTKALTATIGANNLFDVYQDIQAHSSNMSLGRFVYSRRVQQMGYNGAYYFARLRLALPMK